MPEPSLLERLKERKLFQWAVAYLAGAWAFLEATGFVADRFYWPDIILQALTIVAIFGFFAALVLAWYHGEKGRQRVSGPELLILAMLFVLGGIGISFLTQPVGDDIQTVDAEPTVLSIAAALDSLPGIAVLPFANRSERAEDRHFTDGIHDELLTALQRIGGLKVISNTSVQAYRDPDRAIPTIGQELGVAYILEGGVQRAGDRVRINVQLIDALNEGHIWAETYDRELDPRALLDVQSEIVRTVSGELGATLNEEEFQRLAQGSTTSLEAYELLSRARQVVSDFQRASYVEAMTLLEQAVRIDPSYTLGWSALATARAMLYQVWGERSPDMAVAALEAAERVQELDPGSVEAELTMALYLYRIEKAYDAALERLDRVAGSLRGDFAYHNLRALAGRRMGRWEDAIRSHEAAIALDPRTVARRRNLATTLLYLRRFEAVERVAREVFALSDDRETDWTLFHAQWASGGGTGRWSEYVDRYDEPFNSWHLAMVRDDPKGALEALDGASDTWSTQRWWLPRPLLEGWAHEALGAEEAASERFWAAVTVLERQVAEAPEDERLRAALGLAYASLDQGDDALREARRAVEIMPRERDAMAPSSTQLFFLAAVHARLGHVDEALEVLDDLLSEPSRYTSYRIETEFWMAPIRDDPGFKALMDEHRDRVF
jgi:TolB-like protein/predicted Zn-dependent protease